ncbi:helix-turn-helix domain-containing protein [Cryobacterium soli]|uniref:helix-turn-helix domain-containing protein n=1 Tax=Cryobacterium soli TaxID=2220095 RepID=UPI000E72C25B|nr:helix-turn-helix transcriptional regulator [Cryobacterium soli]
METTAIALGLEIKRLRELSQMNQEDLGAQAGYGKGAGVSISRIESGTTRPTKVRLAGIALALKVTPEQLEDLAKLRALVGEDAGQKADARVRPQAVKDRLKTIQERTKLRTDCVEELGASFNDAHDRARDAYFLRFVDIAKGIENAPLPKMPPQDELAGSDDDANEARATAAGMSFLSQKITSALVGGAGGAATGAAVGGAAAYAAFTGAAMFGTASTGAAISGLYGIAATNATLAVLGGGTLAAAGGGIAAGSLLLTGIVAAPIAILAAGGLFLAHRRTKTQEVKLNAQLDVAEASLDATQHGFDLLADTLGRATAILEYVGVHAAHALEKWERGLGVRPTTWTSLTVDQQQSYRGFIDIAACELAVDGIDAPQFMTTESDGLERLANAIGATLDHAESTVRALV